MTLDAARPRSFDSSSPVLAYWLARAHGFDVVAGRRRGHVEDVRYGPDGHAVQLIVRFGRHERLVPVSAVHSVVPYDDLLILRSPKSKSEPRAAAPARPPRLAPAAGRVSAAGKTGAQAVAVGSARLATGTRRVSTHGWSATRRGGRWLRPRAAAAWAWISAVVLAVLAGLAADGRALAAWLRVRVPAATRAVRARLEGLSAEMRHGDTFPSPPARPPDDARADRNTA